MVRPSAKDKSQKGQKDTKVKKGKSYHVSNVYEIQGNSIKRKNKLCPKCSVFMAKHANRNTCGKCGYTEMN